MLTIHYKNSSKQVIRVAPQFYSTVVQGTGNNKRVFTATSKSKDLVHDLDGCGYTLKQEDTIVSSEVNLTNNNFKSGVTITTDKEALKEAKKAFKNYIKEKYSFDFKHGLSVKQIWNKYAVKSL